MTFFLKKYHYYKSSYEFTLLIDTLEILLCNFYLYILKMTLLQFYRILEFVNPRETSLL